MARTRRSLQTLLLTGLALAAWQRTADAADINAGPSDYQAAVQALQPGDTLHLAAGTYPDLLVI